MKLYYMPGACSLAAHIALRETGQPVELVMVDYQTRRIEGGENYLDINTKGFVPALLLPDGWLLTELSAIFDFIATSTPDSPLAPPTAGEERFRYLEWQSFIATEIHKSFSPLFRPSTPPEFLEPGREHLAKRLATVERHLRSHRYLLGPAYSFIDAYLFTVCRWLGDQEMPMPQWPSLERHFRLVGERPAVKAALSAEGL
jgi:glutathione S-transferase